MIYKEVTRYFFTLVHLLAYYQVERILDLQFQFLQFNRFQNR